MASCSVRSRALDDKNNLISRLKTVIYPSIPFLRPTLSMLRPTSVWPRLLGSWSRPDGLEVALVVRPAMNVCPLFTNVCRLLLRRYLQTFAASFCACLNTFAASLTRYPLKFVARLRSGESLHKPLFRRRPIVKNLASIALAIAVLCVANYAGAHDTSGHNARTSHAASISHRWHDHDKDSDTMWFNFASEIINPIGDDDGVTVTTEPSTAGETATQTPQKTKTRS